MTVIDRVRGDYKPKPRTPLQALPLRPYQREALDALSFTEDIRRLAIVLPTGGGKTVVFAHDAMEYLEAHPDMRVLVLVDLDELVWQAYEEIKGIAPHLNVGVVKGAKYNQVAADVIVASVQSLRNPARRKQLRRIGRVIVDECEAATARTYMTVLTDLGCFRPDGPETIGFTATLMRGDGKSLYPVWQDVAYTRDISWMIRRRYLIPPRGLAIKVPDLDLRKVKTSKADYNDGELGEALAESLAPELVAAAYLEHAKGRRAILFAPTIASAEVFAEAMNAAGVRAEVIHGGMSPEERKDIRERHQAGLFDVLCNCMILTKGYNDRAISCVIMARPTKSKRLYIQMVGRGLRVNPALPYEDQDCLILDVVGASATNDLRSLIDLSEREIKDPHSGRTLVELEDDLDAGGGVVDEDEAVLYCGPVEAREFDPLGVPSTRAWISTKDGTYFLPAGKDHYVFIMEYPSAGRWSVVTCPKETGRPVMTEHRGLPLDQALVWAEDLALDMGASSVQLANRAQPWRKKVASENMASLARALGLKVEGVRDPASGLFTVTEKAGKLADRMTKVRGTNRIDPLVRMVRGK